MQVSSRKLLAALQPAFVFLLFGGIASHTSMVMAQSPGTFTPTGNMTTPRSWHTATLLTNGKVLVTGGNAGFGTGFAGAELYDPSTGTFTATGDMTTPRFYHTATQLPDGKVLIAGGETCNSSDRCLLASAELYDPSTGIFTAAGNMTAPRWGYTATLLNNGKVLIAGGYDSRQGNPDPLTEHTSAELYDPATGNFTRTGEMTTFRAFHTATLLPNGKVLIVGSGWWYGTVPGPEIYDPDVGTFHPVGGTIPSGRPGVPQNTASLTVLMNGKILALLEDGEDGDPDGAAVIYDLATETLTATGETTVYAYTATLLPEGAVLVAGYPNLLPGPSSSADLYDPGTSTFFRAGDMVTPRYGHTASLLPDGTVLMSGGFPFSASGTGAGPVATAIAELYHPPVLVRSPVLLSLSGDGRGAGAVLHATTHQVVSSSNPAVAGEALEIYGTGLIDGSVIPPQVAIGGWMAEILFFGKAPGYAGLNQINVRIPSDVTPGPAVSVRLTYLGRPSNEVTIGVR
jgi:hypothetical protein